MKVLLFFGLLFLGIGTVHAQADCPPGTIPYGSGQDLSNCGPDNSRAQQSQAPSPPPQRWVDHWGALVSDDSQGKLGVATDKANETGAWLAADEDCHAKGGLNCTRLISYRNECMAMVLGDKTYSFSAGATASDAIRQATQKCMANTTNCHVYYTACSLPQRIQ